MQAAVGLRSVRLHLQLAVASAAAARSSGGGGVVRRAGAGAAPTPAAVGRPLPFAARAASGEAGEAKKRIVFLGTPEVAAIVLQELLDAAGADGADFEVAAVVCQPGKPKGRGNKAVPVPCAVEQLARSSGALPDAAVFTPRSAKDPAFLQAMAALSPDLAVTAAYGNMLPEPFLRAPRHGVLNVHPSLLPRYRGAAPVQRALQDGVTETGVSVAFTVLACDAGPVFLQERVEVADDEQAPALLERLFRRGAALLVQNLPRVWSGEAARAAVAQDEAAATHAAKLAKEDAALDWARPAAALHNQVRAFAGWPGAFGTFTLVGQQQQQQHADTATAGGDKQQQQQQQVVSIKILQSRVADAPGDLALLRAAPPRQVVFADGGARMLVPCGGGGDDGSSIGSSSGSSGSSSSALEVLSLQPPTKKAMAPRAFFNGLGGRRLLVGGAAAAGAAAGEQQQQQQRRREEAAAVSQ